MSNRLREGVNNYLLLGRVVRLNVFLLKKDTRLTERKSKCFKIAHFSLVQKVFTLCHLFHLTSFFSFAHV